MERYNYGIVSFLNRKQVNTSVGVNAFLQHKEVKLKCGFKKSEYIEKNWTAFATFIDKGIKSGTIKGVPVRLDFYHDEIRDRKETINAEFKEIELTSDEQKLLNRIVKEYGCGFLHSFLMKRNIKPEQKDTGFTSKKLQFLPLVRQAINEGYLNEQKENSLKS